MKRTTMELGGHAPVIVFDDVDVDKVLDASVGAKYWNAGQVCVSPTRFYVQEKIYSRFVEGFVNRAKAVPVGDGLDERNKMGAAHSRAAAGRGGNFREGCARFGRESGGRRGAAEESGVFLLAHGPLRRTEQGAHYE